MMAEGPNLSFSGSAGLGVNYTGEKKDAAGMVTHESATTFKNFAKVTFKGSGVTDGGLTFGMKVRVNGSGQGGANGAVDDAEVHIGGEMWKITVGDVDQASDLAFSLGDVGFDGDLGVDDIAEGIGNNKANQARVDLTLGAATLAFSVGQQNATAASAGTEVTGKLTTGGLDLSAGQTISFAAEPGTFPIGSDDTAATIKAQTDGGFLKQYVTRQFGTGDDAEYYYADSDATGHLRSGLIARNDDDPADSDDERVGFEMITETKVLFGVASPQTRTNGRLVALDVTRVDLVTFAWNAEEERWEDTGDSNDELKDPVLVDALNEYASYFDLGKDNRPGGGTGENGDTISEDGRKKIAALDADDVAKLLPGVAINKSVDDGYVEPLGEQTRTIAEDSEAIANEAGTVTFLQGMTEATARKTHWSAGVKAELGPVTFGLGADSDDTIMASVGGGMDGFGGNFFYARQDGANGGADTTGMGAEGTFSAGDGTSVNVVYAQAETGNVKMDGFGLGVTHALGGGAEVQAGLARVNDRDSFSAGVVMSF